jgi:DinB superfamily
MGAPNDASPGPADAACKIGGMGTASNPNLCCTPAEYVNELERQSAQAHTLAGGLGDSALNWQPHGGKSWSVAQCLDHLVIMNRMYVKTLQDAVATNRDQLEPRKTPIQPSGWFTRLFLSYEEPPPKIKLPAPSKIAPLSQLTGAVVDEFLTLQQQFIDFVREWGEADLGDLKVKDPLFPLHHTGDTELLIIAAHNRRHLWQAEQVKRNPAFPRAGVPPP